MAMMILLARVVVRSRAHSMLIVIYCKDMKCISDIDVSGKAWNVFDSRSETLARCSCTIRDITIGSI